MEAVKSAESPFKKMPQEKTKETIPQPKQRKGPDSYREPIE